MPRKKRQAMRWIGGKFVPTVPLTKSETKSSKSLKLKGPGRFKNAKLKGPSTRSKEERNCIVSRSGQKYNRAVEQSETESDTESHQSDTASESATSSPPRVSSDASTSKVKSTPVKNGPIVDKKEENALPSTSYCQSPSKFYGIPKGAKVPLKALSKTPVSSIFTTGVSMNPNTPSLVNGSKAKSTISSSALKAKANQSKSTTKEHTNSRAVPKVKSEPVNSTTPVPNANRRSSARIKGEEPEIAKVTNSSNRLNRATRYSKEEDEDDGDDESESSEEISPPKTRSQSLKSQRAALQTPTTSTKRSGVQIKAEPQVETDIEIVKRESLRSHLAGRAASSSTSKAQPEKQESTQKQRGRSRSLGASENITKESKQSKSQSKSADQMNCSSTVRAPVTTNSKVKEEVVSSASKSKKSIKPKTKVKVTPRTTSTPSPSESSCASDYKPLYDEDFGLGSVVEANKPKVPFQIKPIDQLVAEMHHKGISLEQYQHVPSKPAGHRSGRKKYVAHRRVPSAGFYASGVSHSNDKCNLAPNNNNFHGKIIFDEDIKMVTPTNGVQVKLKCESEDEKKPVISKVSKAAQTGQKKLRVNQCHVTARILGQSKLPGCDGLYFVAFNHWVSKQHNLFATCGDKHASIWLCRDDIPGGFKCLLTVEDETEYFYSCAWTYDTTCRDTKNSDQLLLAGGQNAVLRIFNINTGAQRGLQSHGGAINDVRVDLKQPHLVFTASADWTIRMWNLEAHDSRALVAIFGGWNGHRNQVLTCDPHPVHNLLVSAGVDYTVYIWRYDTEEVQQVLKQSYRPPGHPVQYRPVKVQIPVWESRSAHNNYIDCIRWYGSLVMSRSCDQFLRLWHPSNEDNDPNMSLFDLSNQTVTRDDLAASERDIPHNINLVWEHKFSNANLFYIRFDVSRSGRELAVGNNDGSFHLFDLNKHSRKNIRANLYPGANNRFPVRALAFNASGTLLACVQENGLVRLYKVTRHEPVKPETIDPLVKPETPDTHIKLESDDTPGSCDTASTSNNSDH